MGDEKKTTTDVKEKKISIYDVTPENDTTKFRAFLSYRHFRIAA